MNKLVEYLLLSLFVSLPLQANEVQIAVKGMEEVLVPVREPTAVEVAEVKSARDVFLKRTRADDVTAWTVFLAGSPGSPYRLAVLVDVGLICFRNGRFSECLSAYEQAWQAGKDVPPGPVEPLAGHAAGELAMMYARLGRFESLEQLFKELGTRAFRGPGSNLLENARSGFELMKKHPETSFRCGPMALSRILAVQQAGNILPQEIHESASTREGMSLLQVRDLAAQVGLEKFRAAKRAAGAAVLTPVVVHWKVGHYAALVREEKGRYLVEDPTFSVRGPIWITPETLDAEASGYCLTAAETLPAGWTAVADSEAATVWGKGQTSNGDPNATGPNDNKSGGPNGPSSASSGAPSTPCGMAQWSVHSMLVSLNITDMPMGYNPPVGPSMTVMVTYNSMENETLSTVPHSNLGPKWSFNGVAYVTDLGGSATVSSGLGGSTTYTASGVPDEFNRDQESYATLRRTSPAPTFERVWPDGTTEVFGVTGPTGLAYRTAVTDASGNTLSYQYVTSGTTVLLNKIVDANGKETVFEYANGGAQPTKITDPFGRFVRFQYDNLNRLTSVTDVVGIVSQFTYQSSGNFIQMLTTPYGNTQFVTGFDTTTRWLQATYPNGDLERMEFRHNADGIPNNLGAVPQGMMVSGDYNNYRNALHWDRKAMKDAPGDVSKAHLTHFLHTSDINVTSGLVESEKLALEGRVYFNYDGQSSSYIQSSSNRRTKIGRLLDDGSTQLYQLEYNAAGKPTKLTDPAGRVTMLTYDPVNLIDLTEVRQQTGPDTSLLLSSYTYNAQHLPLTVTDGGGNTATYTYNARGQILTGVKPNGDTTTYTYDADGYMTSVDGPLPTEVDKVIIAYDAMGRPASVTDSSGMSIVMEYDNLDRMTKRTYADGAYEQWTYDALSLQTYRTRGGNAITYHHNSLGQVTEIDDALSRKTFFDWCRCGDLKSIIDPAGNMTRFFHDVQGRPTGRAYADGTATQVLYEPLSGRVAKTIDERGQEKIFSYTVDGSLTSLSYGGTAAATAPMTLAWDAAFKRVTQMTDGTGTTGFGYHPFTAGQNGAGRLATVDGPLANDIIDFAYDSQGRATSRSINGVTETRTLDEAGRATGMTNALGAFGYGFDGATNRISSMTLPNGQRLDLAYFGISGTKLLKDVINKAPGGTEVSKFSYAYNNEGSVSSVSRAFDGGAALVDTPAYDAAQRLNGYTKALAGGGSQVFAYSYDAADNRVSETIGGTTTTASANILNQVTQLTPAPAVARSYEWDGAGRLAAIVQGTHRTEFTNDGLGRRVRMVEKESGATVADRRFVWIGFEVAEERDAANAVVKRFFFQGFTTAAGSFYYTRDNLGSIREVLDGTGAVRARYDYDPFGRRVKVSGDIDADLGYAGMLYHAPSQLCLTFARAYDPNLGRWISRDPAGEAFGFNLYAYGGNNPLSFADRTGMDPDYVSAAESFAQAAGGLAAVGLTVAAVASAPVAGPAVLLGATAIVLYNGLNAAFNLCQCIAALNGMDQIAGAGGTAEHPNSFQFNPYTEGLHWLGAGGYCHPYEEVIVLAGGVVFDTLMGNLSGAALHAPEFVGAAAKAAAIAEGVGNFGNGVNVAPAFGTAAGTASSDAGDHNSPFARRFGY